MEPKKCQEGAQRIRRIYSLHFEGDHMLMKGYEPMLVSCLAASMGGLGAKPPCLNCFSIKQRAKLTIKLRAHAHYDQSIFGALRRSLFRIPARMFRCLRLVPSVTSGDPRLATWWGWLPLPRQDFHLQDQCDFSWRTWTLDKRFPEKL